MKKLKILFGLLLIINELYFVPIFLPPEASSQPIAGILKLINIK